MPCISGSYNSRVGPVIRVAVVEYGQSEVEGVVGSKLRLFRGLFDTGATTSCVSEKVVDEVGLKPMGKVRVRGVTGEASVDQYAFGVGFLWVKRQRPSEVGVHIMSVQGTLFHNGGVGFDVILGRDIICRGVFNLSFDGRFTFGF